MKRDPNSPLGIGPATERCIALDRECIRRKTEAAEKIGADYTARIERVFARVPEDLREPFMAALAAALKTELVERALRKLAPEPCPEHGSPREVCAPAHGRDGT